MTEHSGLLERYLRLRDVRFRLNNLLVTTIPTKTLHECGRILGIFRNGTFVFETEDETSVLMEYGIYYPGPDGRNAVARYLEKTPPPPDSDEMVALQEMTHAYYSLFQVVDVERGVGVSVTDLLRGGTGFIVDVGLGSTAIRHMIVATRVVPMEGFLRTAGAALPVVAPAAERIFRELKRSGFHPETLDYRQITPRQEAEIAAIVIRECRSSGMTSHIAYQPPGARGRPAPLVSEPRRVGRNDRCPCGSGRKFKICCGRSNA